MNRKFNPDYLYIEDLKTILEILDHEKLNEEKRTMYRKSALLKIRKLSDSFIRFSDAEDKNKRFSAREAEKILATAMSSSDLELKKKAFSIILDAERLGINLLKSTVLKFRKVEEELAINQKRKTLR